MVCGPGLGSTGLVLLFWFYISGSTFLVLLFWFYISGSTFLVLLVLSHHLM